MTQLFTTILNMSITASYVALAVIAIRVLLKKMPKIFFYTLWTAVFIRLVCPFSFKSAFSLLNFLKSNIQTKTGTIEYIPNNIGLMQNPSVNTGIDGINSTVHSFLPPAVPTASINPIQIIMEIASIIWAAGMVLLLFYSVISYLRVTNNVKTATLVQDTVFETDRITTPFLFGFINPKIYVPVGISANELSFILLHEQTHIKRLDYLIKPLAFLVLIVHWFNPLMWLSFTLMSKDMEMSCDESVIRKMGSNVKSSYSNSLLSLSVKRSGLILGGPLAFGESNIKSRIKNILNYKQPTIWLIALGIISTVSLLVAFTANPQNVQAPTHTTYSGYSIETLMKNKTAYVGNNSKVVALIDAMPLPAGIVRSSVELQTTTLPYGITIYFSINDASIINEQGAIISNTFYRNAIILFSLIDNVDVINCKIADTTSKYDGTSHDFTYTREASEKLMDEDVRRSTNSTDAVKRLIDHLNSTSFGTDTAAQLSEDNQIEKYLEIIISPQASSNPQDYINAHQEEYNAILALNAKALPYLFSEFKKGGQNRLKGHIMERLCRTILGSEDIKYASKNPQDWYDTYKAHTQRIMKLNSLEWVKDNYPKGSLILTDVLHNKP